MWSGSGAKAYKNLGKVKGNGVGRYAQNLGDFFITKAARYVAKDFALSR